MSDYESIMLDTMYNAYYEDLERTEYENWKENMQDKIIDDFIEDMTFSYFEDNEDMLLISYMAQDEAKKIIDISPSGAILFIFTAIETAIKHAMLKPMIYGMTHNEKVADLIVEKFLKQSNFDAYITITFDLVKELINLILFNVKTTNNKIIKDEIKKLSKKRNDIIHSGKQFQKQDALDALDILDELYNKVVMKMLNHINFTIKDRKICRKM